MIGTSRTTGQTVVIPFWVRDDKVGSDALSLKEEETVEKGQAAEALAPAKRKSTGGEPAPKKKKTASKPQAAKSVTGAESDESDGDEEEESEEEGEGSKESGSEADV